MTMKQNVFLIRVIVFLPQHVRYFQTHRGKKQHQNIIISSFKPVSRTTVKMCGAVGNPLARRRGGKELRNWEKVSL